MTSYNPSSDKGASTALRLRVAKGGDVQEVYVEHGLRIGRSKANNIALFDDETVELNHAQIHVVGRTTIVRTTRLDVRLRVGEDWLQELELRPGVCFVIGQTDFECLAGQALPARSVEPDFSQCWNCSHAFPEVEDPVASIPAIIACPGCGLECLPVPVEFQPKRAFVPTVFGAFKADRFVAQGGMGLVLHGNDLGTSQPVAIKLLWPPSCQDAAAFLRFHREVDSLRRIDHPQ